MYKEIKAIPVGTKVTVKGEDDKDKEVDGRGRRRRRSRRRRSSLCGRLL